MRHSKIEIESRRAALVQLIRDEQFVSVGAVCERLNISEATARRDLKVLEASKQIERTNGGALAAFDREFQSFRRRLQLNASAKDHIAEQALGSIEPGMSLFLDAGTTAYAVAKKLAQSPVPRISVYSNNIPVASILAEADLRVILTGGEFLNQQSALFGTVAERVIEETTFDICFMGAEGMSNEGVWNSTADLVRFQRTVIKHSHQSCILLDKSKLGRRTRTFLSPWKDIARLITDATPTELREHSVNIGQQSISS
tara:strand:+ start:5458 stop:6228 length:771 start_codon:yes stop_codon:yes gene_type:complete